MSQQFKTPPKVKPTILVVYGIAFLPDGDELKRILNHVTFWYENVVVCVAFAMRDHMNESGVSFHAEKWAMDKWYELRRVHGKNMDRVRSELLQMAQRVLVITDGDCEDCETMIRQAKAKKIKTKVIKV